MIGMIPRDQLFRDQNKYFVLRMLNRSTQLCFDIFVCKQISIVMFAKYAQQKMTRYIEVSFCPETAGLLESFLS